MVNFPYFGMQHSDFKTVRSTQMGRYAVRKKSCFIVYGITYYVKKVQFSSRNTMNFQLFSLFCAIASLALIFDIFAFKRLNMIFCDRNNKPIKQAQQN